MVPPSTASPSRNYKFYPTFAHRSVADLLTGSLNRSGSLATNRPTDRPNIFHREQLYPFMVSTHPFHSRLSHKYSSQGTRCFLRPICPPQILSQIFPSRRRPIFLSMPIARMTSHRHPLPLSVCDAALQSSNMSPPTANDIPIGTPAKSQSQGKPKKLPRKTPAPKKKTDEQQAKPDTEAVSVPAAGKFSYAQPLLSKKLTAP